jgi:carbon monoxide dehydrogenase subunit G
MEMTNDFRVSVPPAQAWKVFTDVERIAPLLPGAQLQEIEGDEFRGIVKVKVGPIQAQYKGVATFLEQDESAGKVVLKASGRDTRGQGNANAIITATMTADGDGTKVSVVTDLTVTGKVAQFGRSVLADVSGKLIGQFVDALEADLEKSDAPTATAGDETPPVEDAAGAAASGEPQVADSPETATPAPAGGDITGPAASGTATSASASGPRKISSPEPEPVDLLDAAGGSVAKRVLPVAGAVGVLVIFVVLRRRAKGRRRAAARLVDMRKSLHDVPSWDDVRGHLPELPDADELRKLGRRAAKRARKNAKKAASQAALGRKAAKNASAAGAKVAGQAQHAVEMAAARTGKKVPGRS